MTAKTSPKPSSTPVAWPNPPPDNSTGKPSPQGEVAQLSTGQRNGEVRETLDSETVLRITRERVRNVYHMGWRRNSHRVVTTPSILSR